MLKLSSKDIVFSDTIFFTGHPAPVAQLVRALHLCCKGCEFDPRRAHSYLFQTTEINKIEYQRCVASL